MHKLKSENYTSDADAKRSACMLSHFSNIWLFATLWTNPMDCSRQAPLSMGFPRQEYWSGLPFPPPGYLPHQGSNSCLLMSFALWGGFFTTKANWKAAKIRSKWETPRFRRKKLSCILSNQLFFFFCQLCYPGQNFSYLQGCFLFCKLEVRGRSSISPLCNHLV